MTGACCSLPYFNGQVHPNSLPQNGVQATKVFCVLASPKRRSVMTVQRQFVVSTVRWSNPGVGEIFRPRPDRPCALPGCFTGGKAAGPFVDRPPPSSAEVEETIELYLYGRLQGELYLLSSGLCSRFLNFAIFSNNLLPHTETDKHIPSRAVLASVDESNVSTRRH